MASGPADYPCDYLYDSSGVLPAHSGSQHHWPCSDTVRQLVTFVQERPQGWFAFHKGMDM